MSSSITTPLPARHRILLGTDPTEGQQKLYSRFPEFRGFSDRELVSERLEAAIVLGLTTSQVRERVYLLAPIAQEAWVIAEINKVADRMFEHCKTYQDPIRTARMWSELFKKLVVVGRLLQIPAEPPHWVAFGFSVADPVPEWVSTRLLVE